jgi:hypothetical protein
MRRVDVLIDRHVRLAVLVVVGLLVFSLSLPGVTAVLAQETPDLADIIVGTWELSEWGITVTFNDDGTAVQYADGEEDMTIVYEVVRNDYVRIEETSGRVEYLKVVEFSEDGVTVEFESGQVVTLTPEGAAAVPADLTPAELILGEWRSDEDGLTVKFQADGTAIQVSDAGERINIVYEVVTTPVLRATVGDETVEYEIVELDETTLTLAYEGELSTLTRSAWASLSVADMLLGEWYFAAGDATFEFRENDVLRVEVMDEAILGSYRLLDDERVELNLAGDVVIADIIELSDTTLILAAEDDPDDVVNLTRLSEPPQAVPVPAPEPTQAAEPEPIPDDLIGAWNTEGLTITFEADGTGIQTFGEDVMDFTYEIMGGVVTVTEDNGDITEVEIVELTADTLVFQIVGTSETVTLDRGEAPEVEVVTPTLAPMPTWTPIPPTMAPLPTDTAFPTITPTLSPTPTLTPTITPTMTPDLPDDVPAALIGAWRNQYEGVTIVFKADGTVTAKEDESDVVNAVTWELTDDNKLHIHTGDEVEIYRLMSLTDDELVMVYERYEEQITLERVE